MAPSTNKNGKVRRAAALLFKSHRFLIFSMHFWYVPCTQAVQSIAQWLFIWRGVCILFQWLLLLLESKWIGLHSIVSDVFASCKHHPLLFSGKFFVIAPFWFRIRFSMQLLSGNKKSFFFSFIHLCVVCVMVILIEDHKGYTIARDISMNT